jgi:hypothetical protein
MEVENGASCRVPMLVDIAIVLKEASEVVKGMDPPDRSCESLLRYCSGPAEGKAKVSQPAVWLKERSCEVRLRAKAAVEKGSEVGSRPVEENSAKSQLIECSSLP